MSGDLYPPSPPGVPPLTRVSGAYRLRVVLVLASLLIFLALYLALVATSGWLVYFLYRWPNTFVKILLLVGAVMMFLFFLKGLFKRKSAGTSQYVEATPEAQPQLHAFVGRLCEESGSPFPRKIYLSPDVNAAVFYPRSLLSLVFPVRKNLLVGLGLVNVLNLSEFKAVLAHEFGHFAQSSMKLGQYVYVANQAIGDMVFGRDTWDNWLRTWRSVDVRISFPAWAISAIVWVLRFALGLVYRGINVLDRSLSRQLEFNADLHAVSLAGSDAIASVLWRTERGVIAYKNALHDLESLAQHGKFTDDFFFHQARELEQLDKLIDEHDDGSPQLRSLRQHYVHGRAIHFAEGDETASSIWRTHPSNRDRELNAKRVYIDVAPDERSAWEVFADADEVRRTMTAVAYRDALGVKVLPGAVTPAEEIDRLAREEQEEMKQADHYHGMYEDRAIRPGDLDELVGELESVDPAELRTAAAKWTGDELKGFMEKYRQVNDEFAMLSAIVDGQASPDLSEFTLRGHEYPIQEARRRRAPIREEREEVTSRLAGADRSLFLHFFSCTGEDSAARAELLERYGFLQQIQDHVLRLAKEEAELTPVLEMLQNSPEPSPEQYQLARTTFASASACLRKTVEACKGIRLPRLSHMEEGATVHSFVLQERLVGAMHLDHIEGKWVGKMLQQFSDVLTRLRKLHFKNLGALLKLQETLDPELYQ